MSHLRITCFKSFQCTLGEQPVTDFYSAKAQALLIYLTVNPDRQHTRSSLAGMLWPDYPENRARRNLSQTLTALRKSVEKPEQEQTLFNSSTQTISINPDNDLFVDCVLFGEHVQSVRNHTHNKLTSCSECMTDLQEAVNLYTGPFLDTFAATDSDLFYEWVLNLREKLHQDALYAFTQLSQSYAERGVLDKAIATTHQLLALAPWQEDGHQQLMRLYASNGQRSQALSQYTTCSELLMDEFGVAPSAETDALYDRILAGELQPVRAANQANYTEEVDESQSPPDPGYAKPIGINQYYSTLPPLEDLLGRDAELDGFSTRLKSQKCVPIIGMTGVGKSALARHIAQHWIEQNGVQSRGSEQVFWHEFYPNEAEEIIERFAGFLATHGRTAALQQLQSSDVGAVSPRDLMGLLAQEISQGHYLLCLDNIHTVEDVAEFEPFLGKLLDAIHHGPSALMLIGQQMPRKLKDRRYARFRADALGGISSDGVREFLAQFGVQNGLVDQPGLIEQLHAVTGGNAEMLTLIRAWVDPSNLVADLLNELYNVEAVNEFMLYKIHEELAPRQHQVMAVIAAFLGHPAPREAIEQVMDSGSILDDLRALKERHLIQEVVNERGFLTATYRIHDIVRGFYYQTLGSSERTAVHRQLGHFYQGRQNTLRALQQFEQIHETTAMADLLIDQAETLIYRGHLRRTRQLLESIRPEIERSTYANIAEFHQTLGLVHRTDGNYAKAHDFYTKALTLVEGVAEDEAEGGVNGGEPKAQILLELGNNSYEQNEYDAALGYFTESRDLYRTLSDEQGEANAVYGLGRTYYRLEKLAEAQSELEACKALAHSRTDRLLLARSELTLGLVDWQNEALPQAQNRFTRALATFDEMDEFKAKAHALINLGILEYALGNSEASLGYYQQAQELCETIGDSYSLRIILHNLGYHFLVNNQPGEAIHHYQQLLELDHDESSSSLRSRAYSGLAQANLTLGGMDKATEYANQAEEIATNHGLEAELGIALRLQGELRLAHQLTSESASRAALEETQALFERSIELLSLHKEKDDLIRATEQLAGVEKRLENASK